MIREYRKSVRTKICAEVSIGINLAGRDRDSDGEAGKLPRNALVVAVNDTTAPGSSRDTDLSFLIPPCIAGAHIQPDDEHSRQRT